MTIQNLSPRAKVILPILYLFCILFVFFVDRILYKGALNSHYIILFVYWLYAIIAVHRGRNMLIYKCSLKTLLISTVCIITICLLFVIFSNPYYLINYYFYYTGFLYILNLVYAYRKVPAFRMNKTFSMLGIIGIIGILIFFCFVIESTGLQI